MLFDFNNCHIMISTCSAFIHIRNKIKPTEPLHLAKNSKKCRKMS